LVSSRKTGEFFYSAVHIDKPLATLAAAGRKWHELTRFSTYHPAARDQFRHGRDRVSAKGALPKKRR
jgi:hypothetical protein